MGPTELEEMLDEVPFRPIRLTLATGELVKIERRDLAVVASLVVFIFSEQGDDLSRRSDYRLISIPNIVIAERYDPRPTMRGRR